MFKLTGRLKHIKINQKGKFEIKVIVNMNLKDAMKFLLSFKYNYLHQLFYYSIQMLLRPHQIPL